MVAQKPPCMKERSGEEHFICMPSSELEAVVKHAIEDTLTRLGFDVNDPQELQRDLQHVRTWRRASEEVQRKGVLTILGILLTGGCAILWLGIKHAISP